MVVSAYGTGDLVIPKIRIGIVHFLEIQMKMKNPLPIRFRMEESVSRADNLGTRITLQIWTEGEIGAYGCEDRVLVLGRSVAPSSSPAQSSRSTHRHVPTVVIPQ